MGRRLAACVLLSVCCVLANGQFAGYTQDSYGDSRDYTRRERDFVGLISNTVRRVGQLFQRPEGDNPSTPYIYQYPHYPNNHQYPHYPNNHQYPHYPNNHKYPDNGAHYDNAYPQVPYNHEGINKPNVNTHYMSVEHNGWNHNGQETQSNTNSASNGLDRDITTHQPAMSNVVPFTESDSKTKSDVNPESTDGISQAGLLQISPAPGGPQNIEDRYDTESPALETTTPSGLVHIPPAPRRSFQTTPPTSAVSNHNNIVSSSDVALHQPGFESRNTLAFTAESCEPVGGGLGSCVSVLACPQFVALLQKGPSAKDVMLLKRSHCGFNGTTPKACCPRPGFSEVSPPTTTAAPTSASTTTTAATLPEPSSRPKLAGEEEELATELPAPPVCGVSNGTFSRVVNGVPAKLGDFPWMALLGYRGRRDPDSTRWLCGGTLISTRHVLSAAHCIHGRNDLFLVRLGELNLERDDDGATPIDVPIRTIIKHQEYSPTTFVNDIGILVLDRHIHFTALIMPICMPTSAELLRTTFERYTPFVAGWGDTEFRGPAAPHLQMVQLPVVSTAKCARAYASYKKQSIDERVLCAGYDKGGRDACQGDSGGPLMQPIFNAVNDSYFFYQIGVISFGRKCAEAGFPGVYSRVTHFVPWIQDTIARGAA